LLPVRHPKVGVVAAGLDEVTGSDGQSVATGGGDGVVDLARLDPACADALIQGGGLVVGRHGDGLASTGVLGDVLTGCVVLRVQGDEVHGGEVVEHCAGVLAVTHRQGQGRVISIMEAVEFSHVVGAATNLGGHVQHPAPAHG